MSVGFWDKFKKSIGIDEMSSLLKDLESDDPLIRKSTLKRLGEMNTPEVVEPIMKMLDDPNMGVRQIAVEVIGWLQHSRAIPKLFEVLSEALKHTKLELVGEISNTLWLIGTASLMPLIHRVEDEDPLMREFAVQTLVQFKDKRSFEPIKKRLKDENRVVRLAAVEAVKALLKEEGVEVLSSLLNDPDIDIRVTVENFFKDLDTKETKAALKAAAAERVNPEFVRRASRMKPINLRMLLARHHPPEIEDSMGTYKPTKEDLQVAREVQICLAEAKKAISTGDKHLAIEYINNAIELSKADGALCYKLSQLYEGLGDKEKALLAAQEAVKRQPNVERFKKRILELS